MIESVLPVDKLFKLEFLLKIYLLVVELVVVMDVMEVIYQEPGTTLKEMVLLLDGFTTQLTIADHTVLLHVIITQQVNINHVVLLNQHQNV